MKTCTVDDCENLVEGNTDMCSSHNRLARKMREIFRKESEKRKAILSQQPKKVYKAISKDPKDWSNTFLCSDGTRIKQSTIKEKLLRHYSVHGPKPFICEGCGASALFNGVVIAHAHIIPQSRCKHLGKTELIWNRGNWFFGCNTCNSAIENPKGEAWKQLRNKDKCLEFIKQHDPELYQKFMNQ